MRDAGDDSLDPTEAELRSADLIQLRRTVGDAAFDTAYDAAKALSPDAVIAIAIESPTRGSPGNN